MDAGLTTYKRLKGRLDLQEKSMTQFATGLGTSIQCLKSVILNYAGSDRIPRNAKSRDLLDAVFAKLNEPDPLEAETVCHHDTI